MMSAFGMAAILLIGSSGLVLTPQDKPVATDKWKIDFKLSLERKGGLYVFVMEGTADVPPETVLRARVYALEIVDDFQRGKREDEEPLVWEDEGGQSAYKTFSPVGGKFREEVYRFVRKPWSIRYRGRVHYVPRDQPAIIAVKLGDDDFSRHHDIRLGTEAEYGEELRSRVKEVADDLVAVEKLYGELSDTIAAHSRKFDAEAWKKWRGPWEARVEIVNDRNNERYSLWAVWMERQAKMRVGGMCELMRRIANSSQEMFTADLEEKVRKEVQGRVDQMLKGFHDYFEEAIEVIGIDAPLDHRKVGPILKAYEEAFFPLRNWILKKAGGGPQVLRKTRREGIAALLDLPPLLQNRKRAYLYVNEVSLRFTKLLELMDAGDPSEAIDAALKEHDAALAELKKFAGLK